ncbi:helix-turn-helix transcriptional regulator, partial [Limnohabitans sp. Rim8]|uniref:helix-turn-helix transcriptional regulator n=1 Tax=Limnohabitans sp. Rim8 TaxID=1100718 RepID=UPI00345C2738
MQKKPLFLRESQIVSERGNQGLLPFSRSTLLRRVAEGEFPKPVNLGGGVRA